MCQVYSTILIVAAQDKAHILQELPVRLLMIDTGKEAVQCLRQGKIDTVVSRWNVADMPDGLLLEKIISARPKMPTVAFIEPGNHQQEIWARALGVTAILNEGIDDDYFRSVICQILNIQEIASVSVACSAKW